MSGLTEVRLRAWETRRAKYGPRGHSGTYARLAGPCRRCESMLNFLIRLHVEGTLSEGQVARVTGLHRIEIRAKADDFSNGAGGVNLCVDESASDVNSTRGGEG